MGIVLDPFLYLYCNSILFLASQLFESRNSIVQPGAANHGQVGFARFR